jgi:hypothetical protein
MRASTYTPSRVIASAPGPRYVCTATVKRRSKISLTCDSHVETVCSCVHRTIYNHDKKLPPVVYAFIIHSWELIRPGLCLPSLFKQRPLGFSHLLLRFSFQLVLNRPAYDCRSKQKSSTNPTRRFDQETRPRPFDISISEFWPCASQLPSRLTTEKSGSLPSPWTTTTRALKNKTFVLYKRVMPSCTEKILTKAQSSRRMRTNNASRIVDICITSSTPSNARCAQGFKRVL